MFQVTVRNGKTGHEETTYGIYRYDIEYLYNKNGTAIDEYAFISGHTKDRMSCWCIPAYSYDTVLIKQEDDDSEPEEFYLCCGYEGKQKLYNMLEFIVTLEKA